MPFKINESLEINYEEDDGISRKGHIVTFAGSSDEFIVMEDQEDALPDGLVKIQNLHGVWLLIPRKSIVWRTY